MKKLTACRAGETACVEHLSQSQASGVYPHHCLATPMAIACTEEEGEEVGGRGRVNGNTNTHS